MRCATCRYGVEISGGLQCRRYPPQLMACPPHPHYPAMLQTEERWPWVDPATHWCGEHKERQP